MFCKICENKSVEIFTEKILNKYQVKYFQCTDCKFIQTEEPYWLSEAYQNAIAKLDIGLIWRNLNFSKTVEKIIKKSFNVHGRFLDYGGGYGMFVRMMRDKGFDFYRQDLYCENLFAQFFDIDDLEATGIFELVTAFEVFEHVLNPVEELTKILKYSDNILFSTELQPNESSNPSNWWYFVPMTGQHISLYSKRSLERLASKFNLNFYSDNFGMHLLAKYKLKKHPFQRPNRRLWDIIIRDRKETHLKSLLMKDFEYVKGRLGVNEL